MDARILPTNVQRVEDIWVWLKDYKMLKFQPRHAMPQKSNYASKSVILELSSSFKSVDILKNLYRFFHLTAFPISL